MSVDHEKIRQKLHFIRENLAQLEQLKGMEPDRLRSDMITEAAAIKKSRP